MSSLLLIATDRARSGAETTVAALATGLRARGWRVGLATLKPATDDVRDVGPALVAAGVELFDLGEHGILRAPRTLKRILGDFAPMVVHAHLDHAIALAHLVVRDRPLVTTLHSFPRSSTRRALLRFRARRDAATITVSGALARHARERLGVVTPQVISNGAPEELLAIGRARIADASGRIRRDPVVACLARLIPEKGLDDLIAAFARLRHAHPSARLLIGGEGPDRARLEGLCRVAGLDPAATLPGFARSPADVLAGATVFCLPSRSEGFGLAALEAMATGLPCVLGDLPALRELAGASARYVAPGDVDALAAALDALLSERNLREQLGRGAHARACERSERHMIAAHERLYRSLLDGSAVCC